MQTTTEIKANVLNKAAEDSGFRARLIADPKATISEEMGTVIPDGFDMVVHEDDATTSHLVLPPTSKLTDDQLAKVSGGIPDFQDRPTW